MSKQPQKGLPSLKEAFKHDLVARWHSKDELEAKLQWVLDRADKYAAFCGATRDEVLAAWESKRDSWWLGYYAEHKQPDPRGFQGKPVLSYDDWLERGKALYGPDMLDWKFVCPVCGHVQTLREFADGGVDPDYGVCNCASRFGLGGNENCQWTTGGALVIGGLYVINRNYIPVLVFDFAADAGKKMKSFNPGDIVQILGLEGPLNGKFGEVISILPDGSVEVKVAEVKIGAFDEIPETNVVTVSLSPENLFLDERANYSELRPLYFMQFLETSN